MARTGRPSKYTPELAQRICEAIALDTRGIDAICEANKDFPDGRTVRQWLIRREEFRPLYAQARESQMEMMAGEILSIAEEEPIAVETFGKDGRRESVDNAGIQRNRLRVDTRKWLMSKLAPKKYGERTVVTGEDGGPVVFAVKSILEE